MKCENIGNGNPISNMMPGEDVFTRNLPKSRKYNFSINGLDFGIGGRLVGGSHVMS